MKIKGRVAKGKGEGRKLGFPTINIVLSTALQSGVYGGKVFVGGKTYLSAIFVNEKGDILEAHLLDFIGDLYGQEIEIEIKEKIRDVAPFKNNSQMKKLIATDIKKIRSISI